MTTSTEPTTQTGTEDAFAAGCAWIEGEYLPIAEARIPILDAGFVRSDLTYDVVGVWEGSFFRLPDHMDRLPRGGEGGPAPPGQSGEPRSSRSRSRRFDAPGYARRTWRWSSLAASPLPGSAIRVAGPRGCTSTRSRTYGSCAQSSKNWGRR